MLFHFLEIRAIPLSHPINQTDNFNHAIPGEDAAQRSSSVTLQNFLPQATQSRWNIVA